MAGSEVAVVHTREDGLNREEVGADGEGDHGECEAEEFGYYGPGCHVSRFNIWVLSSAVSEYGQRTMEPQA